MAISIPTRADVRGFGVKLSEIARNPVYAISQIGLYRGVAMGMAILAIWDGAGYFAKGNSVAQGGSFRVLRDVPYFGMHLHGFIMLCLAVCLIYQSHDGGRLSRGLFLAVLAYSAWIIVAMFAGWEITGEITWSAPSKWFLIFWLNLLLAPTGHHSARVKTERA